MFRGEKIAKISGSLTKEVKEDQDLKGILLQKDFKYQIVSKEDLKEISYTGINQRVMIQVPEFDYVKSLSNRFEMKITEIENYKSYKVID